MNSVNNCYHKIIMQDTVQNSLLLLQPHSS